MTHRTEPENPGPERGKAASRPISLVDVFYVLFKYRKKIVITFLTAAAVSLLYAMSTTPVYEAETKILVKLGREKISEIDAYTKESFNILFQERSQNINNEIEIIRGRYLAERVLERLEERGVGEDATPPTGTVARVRHAVSTGVDRTLEAVKTPLYAVGVMEREPKRTQLLKRLMTSVRAEFLEDTDIIRLTFKAHAPELAALVVDTYASEYLHHHIAIHETDESLEFYTRQIQAYEESLAEIEGKLQAFLKTGSIADLESQKGVLLRDLADIEKKYDQVAVDVETTRQRLTDNQKQARSGAEWIETPNLEHMTNEVANLVAIDNEYVRLSTERDRLLENYQPTWRNVTTVDSQLARLREKKIASLTSILDAHLSALRTEQRILQQQIADKRKALAFINDSTVPLEQLQRERSVIEESYLLYKKKAEELRISEDLNKRLITSVKVMNPAIPPLEHVYPRRTLIVLLGSFLGLFAGIGYAFVSEFFNHTFKNEQDVAEILGIPTLMTIPEESLKRG